MFTLIGGFCMPSILGDLSPEAVDNSVERRGKCRGMQSVLLEHQ